MKERTNRPSIIAVALLLIWAMSVPCTAQSLASATTPTTAPTPASRLRTTAAAARPAPAPAPAPEPPPLDGELLKGQDPRQNPPALPSTVSPAIERFLKENGGKLPTPPPLPVGPSSSNPHRWHVPSSATPETNPRVAQGGRVPSAAAPRTPSPSPSPSPSAARRPGGELSTTGPGPMAVSLKLKPAPLEATDRRFPINLGTALRLSDARPLVVAAAQAGVWVAEAQLTRAKVLWVPTAMFGYDWIHHDGGGPDFNKGIMTAPSVNYSMTGGAADIYINITDAYFQPLIARQNLNSAHWDTQAAKNDALMQTADAYFRVHQYRGMYSGALYTVERGRELVERISDLSAELVPKVEVDRARNMLADLEQRAVSARQEWRVASADLTQVLRLDPRAVVVPLENDHVQITLIDPGRPFDDLMPIALTNRPEISSRRAALEAAEVGVRQEKMRPLLPIIMVNGFQHAGMFLQGGYFGIGPNSSMNQYKGRFDVSLQMMWQLEAFGVGNLARIKQQRGRESAAVIDLRNTQDRVAADVNRALARVQSAAARVLQADRALRTGIITFNGHLEGLEQTRRLENVLILTFRPQEAVYSLDLLNVAFNEYFTTVADYNRAQFELFHSLGYPAAEIARLRVPGELAPVELVRPPYLPPVGNGPPPATR